MSESKITVEIYCNKEDANNLKLFIEDCLDRARCDVIFSKYINLIKDTSKGV